MTATSNLRHSLSKYVKPSFFLSLIICLILSAVVYAETTDEKIIYIGVVNKKANNKQYDLNQYSKFISYIDKELKKKSHYSAKLTLARDLDDLALLINNGKISLLMESVMPTLRMQEITNKIEPALLGWRKGQRDYHTVFFTRKDSNINSIEDISGHSIAFEAPRSTSAFFVPVATLQKYNIDISNLPGAERKSSDVHYVFAGTELNQAYWVHKKRVDSAAFNNGDWDRLPMPLKKDLKIIHKTRPILRWIISLSTEIPKEVRAHLIKILTEMDETEDGKIVLTTSNNTQKIDELSKEDHKNLEFWRQALSGINIRF